jgi:hypothetical protein
MGRYDPDFANFSHLYSVYDCTLRVLEDFLPGEATELSLLREVMDESYTTLTGDKPFSEDDVAEFLAIREVLLLYVLQTDLVPTTQRYPA